MSGRHLQTMIALVLAGLWGFGVYFAHSYGHLRFLDRAESAMTDLRTLVRGTRMPPDLLTIVAIDDAAVTQKGSYPRYSDAISDERQDRDVVSAPRCRIGDRKRTIRF
jgi:adenylate cyclase